MIRVGEEEYTMTKMTTGINAGNVTDVFVDFQMCENLITTMRDFRQESFIPILCMVAEEWAKAHDTNVCELIDTTARLIHEVNAACGKY